MVPVILKESLHFRLYANIVIVRLRLKMKKLVN
jgi:hypothetical protein